MRTPSPQRRARAQTRRHRSGRDQRGQATIDYVALIAVLALLVGAGTAAAASAGAPGVANAVLGQMRRALCIVTGNACPAERSRPCVVASRRDSKHIAVSIAIVRIDEDHYALRERMSDGTIRLTFAKREGAGVEGGVGARARLKIGKHKLGFDREAHGAVQGVLGHGEVYIAHNDREADAIVRAVGGKLLRAPGGPRPDETIVEGGLRGIGRLGLGNNVAGLSLDAVAEAILGARRDEHSGETTISLGGGGSGWGLLNAAMSGPSGVGDSHVTLALTLDRRRRPIELAVTSTGTLTGGAAIPNVVARALRATGVDDDAATAKLDGRRWELAARVDLRDPDVAAAWHTFARDPTDRAAIRALGAQLRERAHLDARTYALDSTSNYIAGGVGLGLKLGGEYDRTTDRARLLAAASRPPFGLWEQRVDCA